MEVSSESLLHDRVKDFNYDIVGITNITGDHLNIHKTFDNYVECKKKLLELVKDDGYVVLNGDDDILKQIECPNMWKFGFGENNNYIINKVDYNDKNTIIEVVHDSESFKIVSPYKARYNVYNVVMAFIIRRLFGLEDSKIIESIKKLDPIKGRTEVLDFGQNYDIILNWTDFFEATRKS